MAKRKASALSDANSFSVQLIDLQKLRVSPKNVRHTQRDADIGKLAESIKENGLLQPLVAVKQGNLFDVIIGQRRLQALIQLGEKTAPVRILDEDDPTKLVLLSLAENLQRRELAPKDKSKAMYELWKNSGENATKVAEMLGVSPATVRTWVAYAERPPEYLEAIEKLGILKSDADRAWIAAKADSHKAIAIAKRISELTKAEKTRLVEEADKGPDRDVDALFKEARRPVKEVQLIIVLPKPAYAGLEKAAAERGLDVESTGQQVVAEWLEEKGYLTANERKGKKR